MLSLFNKYIDSGDLNSALMIGRNMVNKSPDNSDLLDSYLNLLFDLAEKLPIIDERKSFLNQANLAIAFFSENVCLNDGVIQKINEYNAHINSLNDQILSEINQRNDQAIKEIEVNNRNLISQLRRAKEKIYGINKQNDLDQLLTEISDIDEKIEHDYLTNEQKSHYEQISKECTSLISDAMREIERVKNVDYNKKAVVAFNSAFEKFKNNESTYKNQTQLYTLVSQSLFAYDASRLFNETLIYYNHIYSYIFSKLDDNGKFALTRFSIECERKLR